MFCNSFKSLILIVLPLSSFADDGGVDSERTFVKQLVQKYMNDGSDENLFNEEEDSDSDEF